tara:strand:+ start:308 stop:493 length:186 start_codon:yes stop_codon:yes gene_type:complete
MIQFEKFPAASSSEWGSGWFQRAQQARSVQASSAFETRLERARDCAIASPESTSRLILFLW